MGSTIELTDANFEEKVISSSIPVLVDFWAVWCGPCKMIGPIVEQLGEEYAGKLMVGKVDVDNNRQIAMDYGIRSIPTLLIFKDGQVVQQMIGAMSKAALEEKIKPFI